MAKKAQKSQETQGTQPVGVEAAVTPVETKTLSDAERCRAAFLNVARAAIEVEQLTPAEVREFAALVDTDGTPLHIAEDGTEAGKLVRHGEHDPESLRLNCSQRFTPVWQKFQKRLREEKQERTEKATLLAKQNEMLAAKKAAEAGSSAAGTPDAK